MSLLEEFEFCIGSSKRYGKHECNKKYNGLPILSDHIFRKAKSKGSRTYRNSPSFNGY